VSAKRVNLLGQRFGKLTVIAESPSHILGTHWRWVCKCDCGNIKEVSSGGLRQGQTRSCGCLLGSPKRPYEWLYNRLTKSAKAQGHEITLTYEEFLVFVEVKMCHYCEAPIKWLMFSSSGGACHGTSKYNLDRMDNTRGYTKDNIVVCCARCNWGKADKFSYEEWLQIGQFIRVLQSPKSYAETKRMMYERDGWRCRCCNNSRSLTPHHIKHRSQGGKDTLYNLICLCVACHSAYHEGKLFIEQIAGKVIFKERI